MTRASIRLGWLTGLVVLASSISCSREPAGSAASESQKSVSRALTTSRQLTISVRDSETGIGIPAEVAFTSADGTSSALGSVALASGQRTEIAAPQGKALVRITALGHLPLDTYIDVDPLLPTTMLLDPEVPTPELAPDVVAAQVREGFAMLHGHVIDVGTGVPVEGARVSLNNAGVSTETNKRGYFVLQAPVTAVEGEKLPQTDNLVVEQAGYKTYTITRSFLTPGATHFQIDLESGVGAVTRDDTHKILAFEEGQLPESPPVQTSGDDVGILANCNTSVRLGTSCSCTTCSSVVTLSRGTYVKRGLNDEWIGSWNADSLRAGAVAYRSYGCWYTLHPLRSNYDICNNACCQVNDSDTYSATDNAVDYTSGEVLAKSGATYRAEYAAENNNGACADGETGDPANNWPCMNDLVCKGTSFNGHGRGMCQWGSQRHAVDGKSYTWILNHYYNNNGNPAGARDAVITSL
jgi:hypothetical protein